MFYDGYWDDYYASEKPFDLEAHNLKKERKEAKQKANRKEIIRFKKKYGLSNKQAQILLKTIKQTT